MTVVQFDMKGGICLLPLPTTFTYFILFIIYLKVYY